MTYSVLGKIDFGIVDARLNTRKALTTCTLKNSPSKPSTRNLKTPANH